jgi:hypothetical protein
MTTIIQEELQAVARRNDGLLTPEAVVKAAESPKSALHSMFTWQNDEAARLWRLHQARNIILRVTIEVMGQDDKPFMIRAWSSLTPQRTELGGGYRETIRVLRQPEMRAQLLADALAELMVFQTKYSNLTELAEVFDAIKAVRKRM